MTKINRSKDCGNSPKSFFVQEFVIAFLCGRAAELESLVDKEIIWLVTPTKVIKGSSNFLSKLNQINKPSRIDIQHVLTHGKLGSVSGFKINKSGEEKAFCHIIEFSSAAAKTVHKIVSYKA